MYICAVCNSTQASGSEEHSQSVFRTGRSLCPKGHPMMRDSLIPGVVLGIAGGLMTGVFAGVPALHFLASPSILMVEGFAVACLIRGMERPEPARRLNRIPAAMALTLPCTWLAVSSILERYAL